MKKKLFFAAIALTTLAGCTDESYVGDQSLLTNDGGAISFNMKTPAITRGDDKTGSSAATDLNNQFVVFGYKTLSDGDTKQKVFDNYQVNYVASSQNTTTTNSANWEYVGYKNLTAAMTGNTGVAGNTGSGNEQTIKYWDYSASNYKFYAYSLGAGKTGPSYANASLMSTSNTYTLEGDQDQLASCYISELLTISDPNGSTPKEVDLRFLSIKSKIQLGFYETIPGYSVKELKFYVDKNAVTAGSTPSLYQAGSATLPKAGTYTITFDSNGKPLLAWAAAVSDGTQATVEFTSVPNTELKQREYKEVLTDPNKEATAEENKVYLGRASNQASKTEIKDILPYANGADLTLKVDYVLVSRDGSGETIEAKGATAVIPAAFTQWKPNYKYTYLFKISDKSNPLIGEVTGLYPITLDAVVASEQDGSQETITTVSEPSITTYAKGVNSTIAAKAEYPTSSNIYVVVDKGGTVQTLTVGTNANLYLVTNNTGEGSTQEITEASVANALANGEKDDESTPTTWTVTGAGMKSLIVTTTGVPTLTATKSIAAGDSPTGVAIDMDGTNNKCAKFTPTAAGTYVFEFIDTNDGNKKYYKIIKVVAAS